VFAAMRALMAAAVDGGVIPVNPCTRVPLPKSSPRVLVPLEPEWRSRAAQDHGFPPYRIAEAMDTYAHLFPDSADLGRAPSMTLSRVLGRNRNGTPAPCECG
jgi:hypothetical protein